MKLLSQGYSLAEVEALRKHYKEQYSKACAKERAVFKELNIGKSIWKSLIPDSVSDGKDAQYNKETIRDRKERVESDFPFNQKYPTRTITMDITINK